jgi:hypothetical protein
MATTADLTSLIARMEGWNTPGTIAQTNNNPGNLRNVGQPGVIGTNHGYAVFATPEDGWAALDRQVGIDSRNGLNLTQFINKYAPPSENNTSSYLSYLTSGLGVGASTPLAALTPVASAGTSTGATTDYSGGGGGTVYVPDDGTVYNNTTTDATVGAGFDFTSWLSDLQSGGSLNWWLLAAVGGLLGWWYFDRRD